MRVFAFSDPQPVDLSVQKSVQSVDLGVDPARVTFELVVTNETGGALSAPVFVRDVLPAGYDYVTGQTLSPTGNMTVVLVPTSNTPEEILVLEFEAVAGNDVQGASASVTFVAEVALPAVGATADELQTDYTNTVALLDEYTNDIVPLNDEDATNNEATAAFVPPLLNIVKGADGTLLGLTYNYTLTVTPRGSFSDGDVITVSEARPPGQRSPPSVVRAGVAAWPMITVPRFVSAPMTQ